MSIIDQTYATPAQFKRAVKKAVVKTPRSLAEIADKLGFAVASDAGNLVTPRDVQQRIRKVLYELADEGVISYEGRTIAREYFRN